MFDPEMFPEPFPHPLAPATRAPNLFVPFVTTKPPGTGHGLGLAISRELTISLNGTLTLENRIGGGCVATIVLPTRNP